MKAVLVLVRREIQSYFVSPIAYTVLVGFLLICGFGFRNEVVGYLQIPPMRLSLDEITLQNRLVTRLASLWGVLGIVVCSPALSMRLFSEERKSGTIELLLTSPVTTFQLVLGKYLGVVAVFLLMLLSTVPYFILLGVAGNPDWAAVGTTYLALLGLGAVMLAMGLLASAITENQIVAVIVTYALFLPFLLIDQLVPLVNETLGDVLTAFSLGRGGAQLIQGVINTHDVVLHASLVFLFLFLSVQVLESNRWR